MRTTLAVTGLLAAVVLAGCGGDAAPTGKWLQEGQGHAWEIEFAADGRFMIHGDGPDHSSHDHCNGTWAREGGNFVLRGRWDHTGKDVRWNATLEEGALEVQSEPGGGVRRFRRK
jgi:hypothetical protein